MADVLPMVKPIGAAKKLFSLNSDRFNPFPPSRAEYFGFRLALSGSFCIIAVMDATKVLIVEDEHFLSTILANRLKKEGFDVNQAFDGEEAINFLKSSRPSLIVLDLILPKKSGFEVLENISKDPQLSQIPVVILSNLGQESDVEKAKSLGAAEYYIKVRTSVDNFIEIVRNILGRFQEAAAVQQQ